MMSKLIRSTLWASGKFTSLSTHDNTQAWWVVVFVVRNNGPIESVYVTPTSLKSYGRHYAVLTSSRTSIMGWNSEPKKVKKLVSVWNKPIGGEKLVQIPFSSLQFLEIVYSRRVMFSISSD